MGRQVGVVLLLFLVPIIAAGAAGALAGLSGLDGWWVSASRYVAELVVSLAIMRRWLTRANAGLHLPAWRPALAWVGAYLALRVGVYAVVFPFAAPRYDAAAVLGLVAYFFLATALAEEIHFRGLLYGALVARGRTPLVAAGVSAALFGLLHLPASSARLILPLIVADGLAFAAIRARTGSVVPSILAHGTANVIGTVFASGAVDDLTLVVYVISSTAAVLAFALFGLRPHAPLPAAAPA